MDEVQRGERKVISGSRNMTIDDIVHHFNVMKSVYYDKVQTIFCSLEIGTSHSQMLGKFEYGGGPIFKVVLEC